MISIQKRFVATLAFSLLLAPWCAEAAPSPFSLFGGVGTTGVYVGGQYRESPDFTTQAQMSGLMLDPGFSSGGERYHLGVRLLNGLISQQWYPWQQGIYLSAGIFLNGNRLSLQPSSANGGHYTLATPAKVTFRPISPYLGVGYSQRFSRHSHWSFNVSAGAAYQGSPTIRVTHGIGPHPQWEQHAYASEVSNLRQSLGGFRWYPVVEINVRYRC